MQPAALYRAGQQEEARVPFFLYVDEAQSFVTQSFMDMISEARKYKLGVFMACQFLDQLQEKIREAIFRNCGTIISFRVGVNDAELLAKEFYPTIETIDLIQLPRYKIYLKLLVDGSKFRGF